MSTIKGSKLTPTEKLKNEVEYWHEQARFSSNENKILKAENVLYKEFFALHFKQGVPSLVKALRQAMYSLQQITSSIKGR